VKTIVAEFSKFLLFFICLNQVTTISAQVCNGSFGDPVVNITFGNGSNGNTGYAPPGAYTYTSSTCPNDGFYTIATNTSGCFGSSWHTVSSDHTGGGAFMLVNASYGTGDFFVSTVSGLCPNTTYEFATWVLNIYKNSSGIQPDLTFTIETPAGLVLKQFNTGIINATNQPQWDKYGFLFTTSAGNPTIVLRISNNAPGGIGNDLALDDITFRPCGAKITSTIVGSSDTVNICDINQQDFQFTGNAGSGYLNPQYQWQLSVDSGMNWIDIPNATQPFYDRKSTRSGKYWYRLTVTEATNAGNLGCRVASNSVVINVFSKPLVNAGNDRTIIKGDSIQLQGSVISESPVFIWTPADYLSSTSILNPTASPSVSSTYTLNATSVYGCSNVDYVKVNVVEGIYVPSAFTPNNDGKNDHWHIPFLEPEFGATVTVFNRYGTIVYEASLATVDWDGTVKGVMQPSGVYIYSIVRKGKLFLKGTVTIIR